MEERAGAYRDGEQDVNAGEEEDELDQPGALETRATRKERRHRLPPYLPELALAHPRDAAVGAVRGLSDSLSRLMLRGRVAASTRPGADLWSKLGWALHDRPTG